MVWEDGQAITLPADGAPIDLGAGSVAQLTSSSYQVRHTGGTVVTITDSGTFLNTQVSLPVGRPAGSVQGLLGADTGNQSQEFTLPNGTVLQQPLSYTDLSFPSDAASITTLPSNVVQAAQALVAAAGITDPTPAALSRVATWDRHPSRGASN